VADATVANRRPTCAFDDGTTIFARAAINANLTASQSPVISFIPSGAAENVSGSIVTGAIPPDLALSAAFRIRTVTVNLQAGDNWGAPQLIVEEWLEA